jgi:exosortase/archaeosortase family protein
MRTLNVAEACAGLRSLMTFISVAGAIAFLSVRPLWQKLVIMASAVPIAIFCNVMRVSVQGLLDHYVSQELSEGFAHATVGMIMLLPAFFLILLVGWAMDQIYIEEADPTDFPASTNLPAEAAGQGKIIIARRRAVQAPAARGSEGS